MVIRDYLEDSRRDDAFLAAVVEREARKVKIRGASSEEGSRSNSRGDSWNSRKKDYRERDIWYDGCPRRKGCVVR